MSFRNGKQFNNYEKTASNNMSPPTWGLQCTPLIGGVVYREYKKIQLTAIDTKLYRDFVAITVLLFLQRDARSASAVLLS